MKVFAFDTETVATAPGRKAPPLACLTWQRETDLQPSIVHWTDARPVFEKALRDPETLIVGHFVAYDMGVACAAWPDLIPEVFAAYDADRVTCTMLRTKLLDIADGTYRGYPDERGVWRKHDYNLDACARRFAGVALKKDGWRKRYGEFRDIPLSQWPARAQVLAREARIQIDAGIKDKDLEAIANGDPEEVTRYPLEDARATLLVNRALDEIRAKCGEVNPFADEFRQARASFWLTLMSAWGLRTYAEGVELLRVQTVAEIDRLTAALVTAGLVRCDGSRDTKAAVQRMLDVCGWRAIEFLDHEGAKAVTYQKTREDAVPFRKTKGGGVSLDRDACKSSDDELLIDYGSRAQLKAVLDKDVPMLLAGTYMPVHTRWDIAATGRTTSASPNIQNLRRLPGIREAFIARDGYVFADGDYPQLELHTLAQACFDLFGYSALGDMLNAGQDPHLAFAATCLGLSYEEAKKALKDHAHPMHSKVVDARQVGKVFNFGSPGGLGAEKLCLFARKTYGVTLTIDQAKNHKRTWLETLPEMRDYFAYVANLTSNPGGEATVLQLRSQRIRGGTLYTNACNTLFQGLGADAAKHAGWQIAKACYVDRKSALWMSRPAMFGHDQFVVETPDVPGAHEAALELGRIMRDAANEWLPDCPFDDVEVHLCRVMSKEARAMKDADGRLVAWTPALAAAVDMGQAIKSNPTLGVAA